MLQKGFNYICTECSHEAIKCPDCQEGFEVLRRGPMAIFGGAQTIQNADT
jgi:hypothetical protein